MTGKCKCTSESRTGIVCWEHPGDARHGLLRRVDRHTSAGFRTCLEPSRELESSLSDGSRARCRNSLASPSGVGCQPDHSAGMRAARVPRGSQVCSGRLLSASGGATPPAVPQVSQPTTQPRARLAGRPSPGLLCDSFSSVYGRAELASGVRYLPGVTALSEGPWL